MKRLYANRVLRLNNHNLATKQDKIPAKKTSLQRIKKLAVYFVTFVLVMQTLRSVNQLIAANKEVDEIQARIEKLKSENNDLEEQLNRMQSDEFKEEQIRDKLGMVKEGETVVILPEDDVVRSYGKIVEKKSDKAVVPNWKLWLEVFRF